MNIVHQSRHRARLILEGYELLPLIETARAEHEAAVRMKDPWAIALWARIIWRIIALEGAPRFLLEPVAVPVPARRAR